MRAKEKTIIYYIFNLDLRGFSPILIEVEDIANKLLRAQDKNLVSTN
jgi:hypothetical protein